MLRSRSAGRARLAAAFLIAVALLAIAFAVHTKDHTSNSQILILVARVEASRNETPEISERIVRQLTDSLMTLQQVQIQEVNQAIAEPDDGRKARDLGRAHHATMVVWGESGQGTTFPSVSVENLNPFTRAPFVQVGDYVTEAILEEPDHLSFSGATSEQVDGPVAFVSGFARYRRAEYVEALDSLTLALRENGPADLMSKMLVSRGNVLLAAAKTSEAIGDYTRAIRINPSLPEAYANRGTAFLRSGDGARAAEDFARALQFGRETMTAINSAAAAAAQGHHQGAIEADDRAIQVNRESGAAYLNRGVSRSALGDHRRALADFSRALQLNSLDATAHFDRGLSYAAQRQLQPAITDYSKALELDPRNAAAYYARAAAYASLEKYEQAVEDLTHAIRINPDSAAAYRDRGANYLLLGSLDRAIADSTHAIKLSPSDASAYFNRGLSYMVQGDPQKAIDDMKKVLEIGRDPALRKNAEEQLSRLRKE